MILKRAIKAPVSAVWGAWVNSDTLPHWWGPDGFSCKTRRIDLRTGGEWVFDMIAPDGTVFPNHHRYVRIEPQKRIDYMLLWGENGPKHADAWVEFCEVEGGTEVTLGMAMATAKEWAEAESFGAEALALQTLANWPALLGRIRAFIHLSTASPGCLASVRLRGGLRTPLFLAAGVRAVFHLVPDLGPCLAPDHRAAAGGAGLDRQVGFAAHFHRSNLICGSGFARGLAVRRGLRLAWRVAMAVASSLWPGARRSAQTASRAAFWAAAGSMIGSG
jgi:uncharacterized protein YndB with AHSA1/START domain